MIAARAMLVLVGLCGSFAVTARDTADTLPTTEPPAPPPGVPAAGPDTAPLPPGTDTPAWDAIRQRCAIAIDERSCIESARHDRSRQTPATAPATAPAPAPAPH